MKIHIEKRALTSVERIIILICIFIMAFGTLFILNLQKVDIVKAIYKDYQPEALNLTVEQKLEDFEYYYDTMMSDFPMIEEYRNTLGIDFEEKREYYRGLVEETESDYEFFCVMSAIANEFPSFHTDVVFPRFAKYETLGCYNMPATLCNNTVYPASVCWDEMLEAEYNKQELRGTMYIGFSYINGEYILCGNADKMGPDTKVLEVNGIDIHEYVRNTTFTSVNKKYDAYGNKLYVPNFYINSKFGEPVILTLVDDNGNIQYYEAFCETAKSAALYLHYAYGDTEVKAGALGRMVYSHIDEKQGIGYLKVDAFSMFLAEDIEARLKEMEACETVILDLRDNYGGVAMLAQKYIYPYLFTGDVSMENRWYMINSPGNRRVMWEDILGLLFKFDFQKEGDYLYSVRSYDYNGEAASDRNILVLIGEKSGSAADGFAAALQKTDAILVGQNTHGEGLADSFLCDYMPNSGLVFTYMFGRAENEDGTDNSLFGTGPDVYSYITPEGYRICAEIAKKGDDPYTYKNRLRWDTVLQDALEEITK